MLGRATGINGGLAGSMNVTSPADRLIGSFGIVGGSIAAATGAALALRRTGGVAVAYFGDGATNQGYFFECLNFCKVMSLPIVLVCENNGYGEYTAFEEVTAGAIRARAEVMEVTAETIDGMSVWETRAAAQRAVEQARSGWARVRRGDHLPVRRPLAQRPGQVPQAGRARALAGAGPARRAARAARGRGRRAGRIDEIDASVQASSPGRGARARRPFPEPRAFSEFKERDDAGADDAEALRLDGGGRDPAAG